METVNIGIIGLGTVSSGVVTLLRKNSTLIYSKTGIKIKLKKVADIDIKRKKALKLSDSIFTRNANEIINDPSIDIVVELIGGTTYAKEYIINALKRGKHIVTANKALLSQKGEQIFRIAYQNNRFIGFEASVAGGVPVIKAIRESLIANRIKKIYGIVNGTTNFILTKMEEKHIEFKQALSLAQKLGFAEANPKFDIEGIDAAHKLQILTSFAFNTEVEFKKIYYEGIEKIDLMDIIYVQDLGYRIKLLAIAKLDESHNTYECRVHPTIIPLSNPLASVKKEYNAILIEGDATGAQIFYGKGAGALPTASVIVADIIDITKKMFSNEAKTFDRLYQKEKKLKMKEFRDIMSRYYLRFGTLDKPGVLAKISGILGKYNISISSVIQKETGQRVVPIVMLTHLARESDVQRSIKIIDKLDVVKSKTKIIRIEDGI